MSLRVFFSPMKTKKAIYEPPRLLLHLWTARLDRGTELPCFASRKVQILTPGLVSAHSAASAWRSVESRLLNLSVLTKPLAAAPLLNLSQQRSY